MGRVLVAVFREVFTEYSGFPPLEFFQYYLLSTSVQHKVGRVCKGKKGYQPLWKVKFFRISRTDGGGDDDDDDG